MTVDDRAQLRALGDQLMRLGRHRFTTYADAVLENSAFRILWQLVENGPQTQRGLAEALELEQSTINRQVNAAIKNGLVEGFAVTGSASRQLRPTERGKAAYEHDGTLRADRIAEALDELGDGQSATLVALLEAFNDALDRAHRRSRSELPDT